MKTIKFPQPSSIILLPPMHPKKAAIMKKVDFLIKRSDEVVYRIKSVFPFDFFPDEVIVDRTKIDILYGMFFATREIMSILIENIYEVTIDYSLFFATLRFRVIGYQVDPPPIYFLKKNEAIRLRHIVTGLILAHKDKLDLRELTIEEVRDKMERIGTARKR